MSSYLTTQIDVTSSRELTREQWVRMCEQIKTHPHVETSSDTVPF